MKVLISKKSEDLYRTEAGGWTQNVEEAQDFKSYLPALEHCEKHGLRDVEALLWSPDPQNNVVLKLV